MDAKAGMLASHARTIIDGLRHRTIRNPACSKEIFKKVSIPPITTRLIVNTLRANGYAVCSNHDGYWISATPSDIEATIAHMESRIRMQLKAINGLKKTLGAVRLGQSPMGAAVSDIEF